MALVYTIINKLLINFRSYLGKTLAYHDLLLSLFVNCVMNVSSFASPSTS